TNVGAHLFGKGRRDSPVDAYQKIIEVGPAFTRECLPARALLTLLRVIEELPAIATARIVYLKSQPRYRSMMTLHLSHDLLVEITGSDQLKNLLFFLVAL